jgi:hypothetical protein
MLCLFLNIHVVNSFMVILFDACKENWHDFIFFSWFHYWPFHNSCSLHSSGTVVSGKMMISWENWDVIIRDYYMTFSISALVLAWDCHIKPDSEAGGLIWVEGWYQGRYGKFHVIIVLSYILHWPFPSIDFYIAKKIFELTNCENKYLRELPLFNLQIFLFRVWFQKYTKQCRSVQWR